MQQVVVAVVDSLLMDLGAGQLEIPVYGGTGGAGITLTIPGSPLAVGGTGGGAGMDPKTFPPIWSWWFRWWWRLVVNKIKMEKMGPQIPEAVVVAVEEMVVMEDLVSLLSDIQHKYLKKSYGTTSFARKYKFNI